jgi:hypothetical protein
MHLVLLIRLSTLQLINISSHLQLLFETLYDSSILIIGYSILPSTFSSIWYQIQFVSKFTNDGCIIILSLSSCWKSLVNYENICWLVVHKLPIHKKILHPIYMCFKHTTSMCKKYEPMKKQFSDNFHQQIVWWEICDDHLILMVVQILFLMLALIISNEILYNLKWKEL